MILERIFGSPRRRESTHGAARQLYVATVAQSRNPAFYGPGRVPDTVEGRFESLCLHGFLVLHRLKTEGEGVRELAQSFFDTMFEDMDRNLREIGIGDLAVGKRIKLLAENFYGRIKTYEEGLANGALPAAIARNLLTESAAGPAGAATEPYAAAVADYVRREVADLARAPVESLAAGHIAFGPPPEISS